MSGREYWQRAVRSDHNHRGAVRDPIPGALALLDTLETELLYRAHFPNRTRTRWLII